MKKLLILMALLSATFSSAYADRDLNSKALNVLLESAGDIQITETFSDDTFYLSSVLSIWMITVNEGDKTEIKNECKIFNPAKKIYSCELSIYKEEKDEEMGDVYESSLMLQYKVNLESKTVEEGYNFWIAG